MISNVNSSPSFCSTRIPIKANETVASAFNKIKKVGDYFQIKYIDSPSPQKAADMIDFDQAAVMFGDDFIRVVGKDGGEGGADRFIGRIMKEINADAEYIDDIKPVKVEGPVIDLEI